ncbi:MAG: TetR/AcrR family transcriptional regulator [Bacteroidales bacterium]|nr:TetR/AcrR family transcriptional regulator [Bacteroidales bacterium]
MNQELRKLTEKVRSLFTKYGIKSMTMDDIARELGMSKKTLYQYIKNKDELVLSVIKLIEEEHEEFFKEMQSKKLNAIQSLICVNKLLHRMFKEYNPSFEFDMKKYHPEIYHAVKKQAMDKMYNAVLSNIKQGKAEGLYRENLDDVLIAKLYASRIKTLNESDLITLEEKMNPEFKNQIFEYHIRGIANKEGIKQFEESLKELNNQNDG